MMTVSTIVGGTIATAGVVVEAQIGDNVGKERGRQLQNLNQATAVRFHLQTHPLDSKITILSDKLLINSKEPLDLIFSTDKKECL